MSKLIGRLLIVLAFGWAGSVSSQVPITGDDIITADGREWAQVSLFVGVPVEDISAVCAGDYWYPEDPELVFENYNDYLWIGSRCSGTLNGYDVTNWRWASGLVVTELFNYYGASIVYPPFSGCTPACSYEESNPSWAPAFWADGWNTTLGVPNALIGILDVSPDDPQHWFEIITMVPDVFNFFRDAPPIPVVGQPYTGVWLYRNLDTDNDGIPDFDDNCPNDANPEQINTDGVDDGGDACDGDDDNDLVCDQNEGIEGVCITGPDNCRTIPNNQQEDTDGDGCGDACFISGCGGGICIE